MHSFNYSEWNPLTLKLLNELTSLPVYNITTNKKEISIRCPLCGDSKKHTNSSHLYIKLDVKDNEPYIYYCQRCHSKGILSTSFLRQLKIYNNDLNITLANKNKKIKKGDKRFKEINKNELIIPIPEMTNKNKFKINYINKRLGIDLGFDDLEKYKIVLNLYDLLDANNIKFLTNKKELFVDTLDSNFLGFVSYDNNYIIMRNLSKKIVPHIRYYNYNIFGMYDNSKRFYSIPNKIDILQPKVNVIITEGIFDILGVFFNIEKENRENTIYLSVNGVGYNLLFLELAKMGFLEMDIKIYSDSDQPISNYKEIKKEMSSILTNKIQIFYNKKEKDFGVPIEDVLITKSFI